MQDSYSSCVFHLCPLRSESQTAESITSLVVRSWVPKVRIQHWQYCWRMFLLLYILLLPFITAFCSFEQSETVLQALSNDPTTLVSETLLFFKSIPAFSLGYLRQERTETHFPTHRVLRVILPQINGLWLWLLASSEWKTTLVLRESQSILEQTKRGDSSRNDPVLSCLDGTG